jgi:hypothetical protein
MAPGLGNCDKLYFTFKFEVWMWLQIYQIYERDQIPIHHLLNKSNLNTDKPKRFLNNTEYKRILENRRKTEIELFINSHNSS